MTSSNKKSFKRWALAGAAATVLAVYGPAFAQDNAVYEFEIESQELGQALTEFGITTGSQVLFNDSDINGHHTTGLEGSYTTAQAIPALLDDTGVEYRIDDNGTLLVGKQYVRTASLGEETTPAPFRVAALAQEEDIREVSARDEDDEEARQDVIVVTGTNIRGVTATGSPSITFDRAALEDTGFSSTEEFFESLPQNLDEVTPEGAFAGGVSRLAGSNSQRASGISLRGLGAGSTLVLLNGKRRPGNVRGRVFDISAIPLSMIERVEVVTGGRSAIYGSDAVAGVVNIVTRTEFDGAQTQVYYGAADRGAERLNLSQTLGKNFERGGFVIGYDYRKDLPLDAQDTGLLESPSPATAIPGLFDIRNFSEQHSGILAGHFNLSDRIELYADAQLSFDENRAESAFSFGTCCDLGGLSITESTQYSAVVGTRIDLGSQWQLDASAQHGVVDNDSPSSSLFGGPGTITDLEPVTRLDQDEATLSSFIAVADGPLFSIGGNSVSAAIGTEIREESYEASRVSLPDLTPDPGRAQDRSRDIFSVFGEVYIPLVDNGDHRLDVSIAGRYDDYSDFGSTFEPQFGIEWEPIQGLTFQGSYSEAFRVPSLFDLEFGNQVIIDNVTDPVTGDPLVQFTLFGGNPALEPEQADTWTTGINWQPNSRTRFAFSYFAIDYTGRIDQPKLIQQATALQDEDSFGPLINRMPTSAELSSLFDSLTSDFDNNTGTAFDPASDDPLAVFPNAIFFDNRRANIGLESVDGIDFQASTLLDSEFGEWTFGFNGTYYLNFERNITATSPTIVQLNEPGKPVDFRIRGNVGWSNGPWDINSFVNYVDDYEDTIATTPTEIGSWTTVDLTIRFDASTITDTPYLDGFSATLAIDNVFDTDPPLFESNNFGLGYDAANADPIGRFVSLRLTKDW